MAGGNVRLRSILREVAVSTRRIGKRNNEVAAYATLDGAEKAVEHLVSLGYDERDVGISPRGFEIVRDGPDAPRPTRSAAVGLIAGLGAMTVVALAREISLEVLAGSVLPLVLWGGLLGTAAGFIVGLLARRHVRARTFGFGEEIAPTRYQVVVDRDQDTARHRLARWWDPEAPPVGWRQSA
jgi:hypothetical protein